MGALGGRSPSNRLGAGFTDCRERARRARQRSGPGLHGEQHFLGRPQIPVSVDGKTYYGCCAMCKDRLARDASARSALDPVSQKASRQSDGSDRQHLDRRGALLRERAESSGLRAAFRRELTPSRTTVLCYDRCDDRSEVLTCRRARARSSRMWRQGNARSRDASRWQRRSLGFCRSSWGQPSGWHRARGQRRALRHRRLDGRLRRHYSVLL